MAELAKKGRSTSKKLVPIVAAQTKSAEAETAPKRGRGRPKRTGELETKSSKPSLKVLIKPTKDKEEISDQKSAIPAKPIVNKLKSAVATKANALRKPGRRRKKPDGSDSEAESGEGSNSAPEVAGKSDSTNESSDVSGEEPEQEEDSDE